MTGVWCERPWITSTKEVTVNVPVRKRWARSWALFGSYYPRRLGVTALESDAIGGAVIGMCAFDEKFCIK